MKSKRIITLSIVALITTQPINYSFAGGTFSKPKAMGEVAVQTGLNGINKLAEDHLPAAHNTSSDFGKNFGVGALTIIGKWAANSAGAATTGAAKVAAAVKAGATAMVTSPAAPYLAAGAAACGAGYGGYKTYRHYHPTPEQLAQIEQYNAQAAQSRAQVEQQKVAAMQYCQRQDAIAKERSFKDCLSQNVTALRTPAGVPIPCQKSALNHAMASGCDQAKKDMETFNTFANNI